MALASRVAAVSSLVAILAAAVPAAAQSVPGIGSRALGMGGAFTAVADDATAIYWNPAGTATGALASVVVDWGTHESVGLDDDRSAPAVRGSRTLVAVTTPVLGLGYYRLADGRLGPVEAGRLPSLRPEVFRDGAALVTDHFAVTLAQTLIEKLHVGAAFKAVRGSAAIATFVGAEGMDDPEAQLDALDDRRGAAQTRFDVDLGVMADMGRVRVGLTARNLAAPEFGTAESTAALELPRTVRAGVAAFPGERVTLALDADLVAQEAVDGRWRALAAGIEVWTPSRRFGVRGGLSVQTVDGARPAGAFGASAAVWKGLSLDGQVRGGAEGAERGWSLGARFTY